MKDKRIRTLIENGITTNGRSVILVVGPKSKNQVLELHKLLLDCSGKENVDVLWIHKKDSENSRPNKKKKATKQDECKGFVSSSNVNHLDYKDVQNVLGRTYDMCVLENLESITPNILAQTIETVRGGGVTIFPLDDVSSVNQLLTIKMDIHGRLKTSSGEMALPRFVERFLLTLAKCQTCIITDDKLNVTSHSEPSQCLYTIKQGDQHLSTENANLSELVSSLLSQPETMIAGNLVNCCVTLDQAKAVLSMIGAMTNKSLLSTVVTTAARGRGKSAALGLSIAAAVAYKFGDIYITAPGPENLKTVFEYVEKGLKALDFSEDDYVKVTSKHGDHCLGMEIYKERGQKIEYIRPEDHRLIAGAKILCIDEAAAIPMTYVKEMMSARFVLMTSTVNGYEGTGRSLSHKLISDLRQTVPIHETGVDVAKETEKIKKNLLDDFNEQGNRVLHEIELLTPVRYGPQDMVEKWLNSLLCLNTGGEHAANECPYPSSCELYYVNKDTLFSGHEKTETFLQDLVSVFAASHYKNSPNDVQMLSDSPNHHIFCLLGPSIKTSNKSTILCAIQVAYEGGINEKVVDNSLRRGARGDGDLIPWIVEEKYRGRGFAQKFGVRVVRIASHPGLQRGGYGSRAMELLIKYYEGRLMDLEMKEEKTRTLTADEMAAAHSGDRMTPRVNLPPLMVELGSRRPERMDYIGASFGLTTNLLRFWKKQGMVTVCVSLTKNALTGEHNGIVLKAINHVDDDDDDGMEVDGDDNDCNKKEDEKALILPSWLCGIVTDFQQSHLDMLTDIFRDIPTSLALETLNNSNVKMPSMVLSKEDLSKCFGADEDILLDHFMKDMAGEKQISHIVYKMAHLVFAGKMDLRFTELKEIIMLGMGIQRKSVDEMKFDLPNTDVDERRAFYKQAIRACIMKKTGETATEGPTEEEEEEKLKDKTNKLQLVQQLRDDMEEAILLGKQRNKELQEFKVSDLKQFSIGDGKNDLWKKEYEKVGKKSKSNILKRKSGDESELVKNMKKNATNKKRKISKKK